MRGAVLGLIVAGVSGLFGCDEPLPAFADPPPYDAGDAGGDPGDDEDAG